MSIFGKKRKEKADNYYDRRKAFFTESEYVGRIFELTVRIGSTENKKELDKAGRELNRAIKMAIADQTSDRDLITIEQNLAQRMYISQLYDERNGGEDALLQQRLFILQNAYDFLESSF